MSKRLFHSMNRGDVVSADFFIIAGQSNCGRARVSEMSGAEASLYDISYSDVFMFNHYDNPDQFQPMNVGSNTYLANVIYGDEFGPEASLFKSLKDYNPKNRYVFKYARGGTTLADRWLPNYSPDWVYMSEFLAAAVNDAVGRGIKLNLKAFIWMQGEDDAVTSANASAYGSNLASFFSAFNSKWSLICSTNGFPSVSNCKKVIGRINGASDTVEVYRSDVRAAQASYCSNPSNNAYLIDTDSYPLKDTVHYSATGQISFGTDIFNVVKDF